MADIKLCDKCGGVFNPNGAWQTLSAITFSVNEDTGRQDRHDSNIELCGLCAIDPRKAPTAPAMRGALAVGRQRVDLEHNVWEDPGGTFHVKQGSQWVGPFSSRESAVGWASHERPIIEDAEADR